VCGFRYRADPRTGEKRLWLHVPGSDPIFTDFDESKSVNFIFTLSHYENNLFLFSYSKSIFWTKKLD